jgi:hypothetical protein
MPEKKTLWTYTNAGYGFCYSQRGLLSWLRKLDVEEAIGVDG